MMWYKVRRLTRHLRRDQAGQSLLIVALAFFVLLVIIGLAIDLGLMYIERIRLGRACDAAALAGAQELPLEELAVERATQYLRENGYDPNNTELIVIGPEDAASLGWDAPLGSRGTITIETFRPQSEAYEFEADKIRVSGTISVPMSFMVLIGFDTVPVTAQAMAENVNKLDVVIVYDKSASMNDDTYCHNCFNEGSPDSNPPPECFGCYNNDEGQEYPAGERMFLPYPTEYCGEQQVLVHNGYEILVAEAEWFSDSTSVAGGANDYHRSNYEPGTTFWMLQRVEDSQASGHFYEQGDRRGAHMMHLPWLLDVLGHNDIGNAPRLDYDFDIPTAGIWYIWIRAQCGPWPGSGERADGCLVHWGTGGDRRGGSDAAGFGDDGNIKVNGCYCGTERCNCRPATEGGSRANKWTWVRLGSETFGTGVHTIDIWGGGTGFRLDKILLTRNPEGPSGSAADRAPSFIREKTPAWSDVQDSPYQYQTYEGDGRYGGPPDTGGRSGLACDSCNPIYGLRVEGVCDNTLDDIFDDAQPVRAAKEAAKTFVRRMRARFDQIAFVEYGDDASISRELNCLERPGMPDGLGLWDPDDGPDHAWTWCYDHRQGPEGYEEDAPPAGGSQSGSVMHAIESMRLGVWTNIAEGIEKGIDVLSTGEGHNGRPYAIKFMVLMTDGVPNRWPGYPGGHACHQDPDLWPDDTGTEDENKAKDCTIYYADEASARNIAIFTIGLGLNLDEDLLRAVAEHADGEYFHAESAEDLDDVFQEVADRMFLRLVE